MLNRWRSSWAKNWWFLAG